MILPYSHQAALIQHPVTIRVNESEIIVYPLRLRDTIKIDEFIRYRYASSLLRDTDLLPDEERDDFITGVLNRIEGFSLYSQEGLRFIIDDWDSIEFIFKLYTRGENSDFINSLREIDRDKAIDVLSQIRTAVTRPTPPVPELKIRKKQRRYEPTEEESRAQIYHDLADKFGWTYETVLDLTDYQVFWYLYLYPDEREHIEELDEINHKGEEGIDNSDGALNSITNFNSGTRSFSTPEEYERWLATKGQT